ncbi:beta-propeller fold lactonase family protein [Oleiharenicola lentus]|uniref:beta-propeller fold lactonase family protein n=1 Tax=Oleiharenicola lentus TaxID=2508720 RepID=UPI003F676F0D
MKIFLFLFATLRLGSPVVWAADSYHVVVTNERSGDLSVFAAPSHTLIATIPVGKRPRGIQLTPDKRTLLVALSGSPIAGPPGTRKESDDDEKKADKTADGIGVVDVATKRLQRVLESDSDPEQLAVSPDGTLLYVTNEDIGAVSVVSMPEGKREHLIPVGLEPEGVAVSPDGKFAYVTCETKGDIHVIDTRTHQVIAQFTVEGRPRTVAFFSDSSHAVIPSELTGLLHVVDTVQHRVIESIRLPAGSLPMGVQLSADNRRAYVSNGRARTVCVVDLPDRRVVKVIKVGTRPWGLALSPDEKLLYTANGPSNDVSVVDLALGKEIARLPAGMSPWGVVVIPQ